MLSNLSYNDVSIVVSGKEAIEKVKEIRPNVILMDITLKGNLDGIEVAKQLKGLVDIPVIFVTATAAEETIQRAKITEPFGFLIKPFNEDGLRVTIEIAIYKHRTEKKLRESQQLMEKTLANLQREKETARTLLNALRDSLERFPSSEEKT